MADAQLLAELAQQLVGGVVGRHSGDAEHPLGLDVVRRERRLPVVEAAPLRVVEEALRRDVERVRVAEAAAADAGAAEHGHVLEDRDAEEALHAEPRQPEVAAQIPVGSGEVAVREPSPALQHADAIALLAQTQRRDAAAEARPDDEPVVVVTHLVLLHGEPPYTKMTPASRLNRDYPQGDGEPPRDRRPDAARTSQLERLGPAGRAAADQLPRRDPRRRRDGAAARARPGPRAGARRGARPRRRPDAGRRRRHRPGALRRRAASRDAGDDPRARRLRDGADAPRARARHPLPRHLPRDAAAQRRDRRHAAPAPAGGVRPPRAPQGERQLRRRRPRRPPRGGLDRRARGRRDAARRPSRTTTRASAGSATGWS